MKLTIKIMDNIGLSKNPVDHQPIIYHTDQEITLNDLMMKTLDGAKQGGISQSWCTVEIGAFNLDCAGSLSRSSNIQDDSRILIILNWSPKAKEAFQLLRNLQNLDAFVRQQKFCRFHFGEPTSSLLNKEEVDCISDFACEYPDFDITDAEQKILFMQGISASLDQISTNNFAHP
jgi:hypothetical protein